MTNPLAEIQALLATTNNGKLMLANIPGPARSAVPLLVKRGFLARATFMRPGDAVRLP